MTTRAPDSLRRPTVLTLESAEAADRLGIAIDPVWTADLTDAVDAPGELQLDPRLVARITARVSGAAAQVRAKRGDAVKAGDFLAVIDSVEVGRLKADWLRAVVQARLREAALQNVERAGGAASEQQRRDAQAAWRDAEVRMASAEQALVNLRLRPAATDGAELEPERLAKGIRRLGLPEDVPDGGSANLLPVLAPQGGVLLSTDVVAGERVEAARTIFVVADTRRLVSILHVAAPDAGRVRVGQAVRFRPDGSKEDAEGKVLSISPHADESTRRLAVQAEVPNAAGAFRASTLGRGRILVRQLHGVVTVPMAAVVRIDGWPVAFVRDRTFLKEGGRPAFHLRPVHLGVGDADNIEVVAGLVPGEVVAVKGVSVLAAELARPAGAAPTPGGHEGDLK